MPKSKPPFPFVNLHGWPITPGTPGTAAAKVRPPAAGKPKAGKAFTVPDVHTAVRPLEQQGRIQALGGERVERTDAVLRERLPVLLRRPEARGWWRVWVWAAQGGYGAFKPDGPPPWSLSLRNPDETRALALLYLIGSAGPDEFNRLRQSTLHEAMQPLVLGATLLRMQALGLLELLSRPLRWPLRGSLAVDGMLDHHSVLMRWLFDAVAADLHSDAQHVPASLCLLLADRHVQAGRLQAWQSFLLSSPYTLPFLPVFEAACRAREGGLADAAAAFGPALKELAVVLGRRRGLVPQRLLQWSALSLLAQPDAASWTAARKLCVAESGSRTPPARDAWGRWVHAIDLRLGDTVPDAGVFDAPPLPQRPADAPPHRPRWSGVCRWTPRAGCSTCWPSSPVPPGAASSRR